jgi:hypothetical protein
MTSEGEPAESMRSSLRAALNRAPTRHSQEARVATLVISIDLPPTGALETTRNGTSPTQSQMDEETKTRQHFVDTVASYLESLPRTPPHAAGNVTRVELLGRNVFSQLNHYLLLVTVDIGDPGIEGHLSALVPQGTQISVVGEFTPVQEWPEPGVGSPGRDRAAGRARLSRRGR